MSPAPQRPGPTAEELLDLVNAALSDVAKIGSPYAVLDGRVRIGNLVGGLPDGQEIRELLEAVRLMRGLAAALRFCGHTRQDPQAIASLIEDWLTPVFEAPQ